MHHPSIAVTYFGRDSGSHRTGMAALFRRIMHLWHTRSSPPGCLPLACWVAGGGHSEFKERRSVRGGASLKPFPET